MGINSFSSRLKVINNKYQVKKILAHCALVLFQQSSVFFFVLRKLLERFFNLKITSPINPLENVHQHRTENQVWS